MITVVKMCSGEQMTTMIRTYPRTYLFARSLIDPLILRMIVTRSLTYYVRIRNTTQDPELSHKHTYVRINFFSHLLVSTKMQVTQTRTQIRTYVFRITLMHPITKNLSLQTYSHEISSYARNCSCLNKFNIVYQHMRRYKND